MVSYLLESATCRDSTLFKQNNAVSVLEVAERVSHQKPGAASEVLPHRIEERRADMSVHAAQHVVEQINVGVAVKGASKGYPQFLPSRKVASPLPDHRLVSELEDGQVRSQAGPIDCFSVPAFVERLAEEDVFLD